MPEVEADDQQETADSLFRLILSADSQIDPTAARRLAWRITRAGFRRPPGQVRTRDGRR